MLPELKRVVAQAVRPVRATMARKRRMREELLNHLIAIFEEEAATLGNDQAALEEAKRRFGDPGELTGQLQQAVPRWDRCRSILENLGYRPDESAWHLAARHFLAILLIYLLWLPIWIFAIQKPRNFGPAEVRYLVTLICVAAIPLVSLWNVVFSIILAPLLNRMGPFLASTRRGRLLLGVFCSLVALGGFITPPFTGVAVLFILMARQAVKQWRYQADWA
jgi:ATP-dependent Clp protease ATP-binding subunit ClpC